MVKREVEGTGPTRQKCLLELCSRSLYWSREFCCGASAAPCAVRTCQADCGTFSRQCRVSPRIAQTRNHPTFQPFENRVHVCSSSGQWSFGPRRGRMSGAGQNKKRALGKRNLGKVVQSPAPCVQSVSAHEHVLLAMARAVTQAATSQYFTTPTPGAQAVARNPQAACRETGRG